VDAPVAHGLLAIAGGWLGTDLRQGPRTLEAMGLSGLDRDGVHALLETGEPA
jgi:opine dehydrogenase